MGNTSTTVKAITTLDIEVAEQQVTTAQLGVASAQTQIESAQLALQQTEDTATARTVIAPISGTVTTLNISDGDTLGSSSSASSASGGAAASATGSSSTSAMIITDPSSIEATVTMAEADIVNVAVGDKVTLTFDALPDLTLSGKVATLDTTGTVSQGVVSYTATIVPDVANDSVKAGMTVTADIITRVTADALVVPSTAVKSDSSGGNYVQILTNGSPVSQTVVVGTSNDTYTQITSGLTEGQEVVTATTSSSAKSTATTARSNGSSLLNGGGTPLDGGGATPGGAPTGAPPAGN
jgi:macrolide-specific efflux system membrane fusion protein